MQAQVTTFLLQEILATIRATGAPFDPATTYVGLYTAVANNQLATTMANITEATYTGYARKLSSPFSGPFIDASGNVFFQGGLEKFTGPSDGTGQNIQGIFIANALTAGDLLYFLDFQSLVSLLLPTDALDFVMIFQLSAAAQWDASIVSPAV